MDPPELASELAPCYACRGRMEPPLAFLVVSSAPSMCQPKTHTLECVLVQVGGWAYM